MKPFLNKLKGKSFGWWGLVIALITGVITLLAWLWPAPLASESNHISPSFSPAQSLGITDPIPAKKPGVVRVVVAKFDESKESNYRVTDLLIANLRNALTNYPNAEITSTNRIITEGDGSNLANRVGQVYDANIVIWGWYGITEKTVPLGIHFDVIQPSAIFHPNSCRISVASSSSQIRKASPNELSDLTLQTNLSNELSYATLFTIGVIRYNAGDWNNSVVIFDDALSHLDNNIIVSASTQGNGTLIDQTLLYYYRGKAQAELGNFANALEDFYRLPNPDPSIYFDIALALAGEGEIERAIETYTTIIQHASPSLVDASPGLTTAALYNRGFLYEKSGELELANNDFNLAIKTDQESVPELIFKQEIPNDVAKYIEEQISKNPQNPIYYYWLGIEHQNREQTDKALIDFNNAIELAPDFYLAREARSHILVDTKDHQAAIDDLNYIFQSADFYSPCNLQNRGSSYKKQLKWGKAWKDYSEVVKLTTIEIDSNSNDAYVYYVRGLAYGSMLNPIYSARDFLVAKKLDPEASRYSNINKYLLIDIIVLLIILYVIIDLLYDLVNTRKKQKVGRKRNH